MGNTGSGKELIFDPNAPSDPARSRARPTSRWSLHDGLADSGRRKVSVFRFDVKANSDQVDQARNALKRAQTLRHPGVLTAVATETDAEILLVTRRVWPLRVFLEKKVTLNERIFGLARLFEALKFLSDGGFGHFGISADSIFVDSGGRFYLGFLDLCSADASLARRTPNVPVGAYRAPDRDECLRTNKFENHIKVDSWGLGCLMYDVLCGGDGDYSNLSAMPKQCLKTYKSLLNANYELRTSPSEVWNDTTCKKFLKGSAYSKSLLFLEHAKTKRGDGSLLKFLEIVLAKSAQNFYSDRVKKYHLLPSMKELLEFELDAKPEETVDALAIVRLLLDIVLVCGSGDDDGGDCDDDDESAGMAEEVLLKTASSARRDFRLEALSRVPKLPSRSSSSTAPKLDSAYDSLSQGFEDSDPRLRDATVKAMCVLADRFSTSTLDSKLVRSLAKLQRDPVPSVRTNVLVSLIKIGDLFGQQTRQRVLIAAFLRGLKDPFSHARAKAMQGLESHRKLISPTQAASTIIPSVAPNCAHPDRAVRETALRLLNDLISSDVTSMVCDMNAADERREAEAAAAATGDAPSEERPSEGYFSKWMGVANKTSSEDDSSETIPNRIGELSGVYAKAPPPQKSNVEEDSASDDDEEEDRIAREREERERKKAERKLKREQAKRKAEERRAKAKEQALLREENAWGGGNWGEDDSKTAPAPAAPAPAPAKKKKKKKPSSASTGGRKPKVALPDDDDDLWG